MGDEQRVRPLARKVGRRPRDADADRVQRPVERSPSALDARASAPRRARPTAGRRRRRRVELERQRARGSARGATRGRTGSRSRAASWRYARARLVIRVAAQRAAEARQVEHERDAEQGRALARSSARARPPRSQPRDRSSRAATRPARPGARRGRTRGEERRRAAVEHGLGGGHRDDEVGLQRAAVDASGMPSCSPIVDEPVLDVVHLDARRGSDARTRAGRAARARAVRPAREPAGDEDRLPLARDAEPLELVRRRRRARPGADRPVADGNRECGRIDNDRRRVPPGAPSPRAAGRRAGSARRRGPRRRFGDGLGGRRRPEHDRVSGAVTTATRDPQQDRIFTGSIGRGGGRSS